MIGGHLESPPTTGHVQADSPSIERDDGYGRDEIGADESFESTVDDVDEPDGEC